MAEKPMTYLGVNHVALVARDMAETVDFYTNVLEMPLVKTVEFPGGRGQHFFFDCGGGGMVAFFSFGDAAPLVACSVGEEERRGDRARFDEPSRHQHPDPEIRGLCPPP